MYLYILLGTYLRSYLGPIFFKNQYQMFSLLNSFSSTTICIFKFESTVGGFCVLSRCNQYFMFRHIFILITIEYGNRQVKKEEMNAYPKIVFISIKSEHCSSNILNFL